MRAEDAEYVLTNDTNNEEIRNLLQVFSFLSFLPLHDHIFPQTHSPSLPSLKTNQLKKKLISITTWNIQNSHTLTKLNYTQPLPTNSRTDLLSLSAKFPELSKN